MSRDCRRRYIISTHVLKSLDDDRMFEDVKTCRDLSSIYVFARDARRARERAVAAADSELCAMCNLSSSILLVPFLHDISINLSDDTTLTGLSMPLTVQMLRWTVTRRGVSQCFSRWHWY